MRTIFHFLLSGKISIDIIKNFEEIDVCNYYFFFEEIDCFKNGLPPTKNDIVFVNYSNSQINELVSALSPSIILLYSLNHKFARVINEIDCKVKIGWFPWGYDIYSLPRIRLKLYGKSTLDYILKKNNYFVLKNRITEIFFDYLPDFFLKHLKLELFREALIAHKKVDYFISYIEEDYFYFSKHYPNNMKFVYAPFLKLEQYLGNIDDPNVDNNSKNLLVGNSASLESNYFEVLDTLKSNKELFNKAYFVLNYGGSDDVFMKDFQVYLKNELPEQGLALVNFMDLKTYVRFLKTCNTAVFLHYRQQAMGNILTLLYLGARVYLSKNNPILDFFNKNGIIIFLFEDDFIKYSVTDLSSVDKINNKEKIASLFRTNGDHIYSNILNIID